MSLRAVGSLAFAAVLALAASMPLSAHCDTMDGPVVAAARTALQSGDVTPVLKWVPKESEAEVRGAFTRTMKVRTAGADARELADTYFFETVVRLHRAGEGEPFTGLKPAGAVDPAVAAADKALANGSADALVRSVADEIASGIRRRFDRAARLRRTAGESVEQGRQYVAAYVDLMHYLEQIDTAGNSHEEGKTIHDNHLEKR